MQINKATNFVSSMQLFKIGVGPSSSHTMGPWRACLDALNKLQVIYTQYPNCLINAEVNLYGSLAQTGKGHGTDIAVICGFLGLDYLDCDTHNLTQKAQEAYKSQAGWHNSLIKHLNIVFNTHITLPKHPNALSICFKLIPVNNLDNLNSFKPIELNYTYYSVGGGFIECDEQLGEEKQALQLKTNTVAQIDLIENSTKLPFHIINAIDLIEICDSNCIDLYELVLKNEIALHGKVMIEQHINHIWQTMLQSVMDGCYSHGILAGGLNVHKRAGHLYGQLIQTFNDGMTDAKHLISEIKPESTIDFLLQLKQIKQQSTCQLSFSQTLNFVTCFALAVNEQNASFKRVVTAPTNGSAGVIPAVLLYAISLCDDIAAIHQSNLPQKFLLVASVIGGLFKQKATISAAMGGCQAEIGVSSAMAASGLAYVLGGSTSQILMAAEIAMEHHLGLTCDPVAGLVQIPCIERNAMGAIKAITAAYLAIRSNSSHSKVSLDTVIETMWQTAQDMQNTYKETAMAGLAKYVKIAVNISEC